MAGHNDIARPGANGSAADSSADDLKSLLDSLALELTGASARHTETIHDMQDRAAAMSGRASAAKPGLPHEYGATIDRIEAAMSSFAERLTDAEPARHHGAHPGDDADHALPDTVRSEVRRAIMSAQRDTDDVPPPLGSAFLDLSGPPPPAAAMRLPFGESGEEILQPPSAAPTQQPSAPPAATIEPSWLEARFASIADRVEQSLAAHSPHNALLNIGARFDQLEQRFDRALGEISNRPAADPEALKSVERQITELFGQLDRATGQLGRLDAIESRLTDLRQSLSDEQMTRLMGALAPTEEKLTAIAMSAAERVAASLRSDASAAPAAPALASDPRLVELTAMLDAFITEQRQGDALSAEALDTMQQAMQHLIDRVEAIEATQVSNHEALMLASAAHPADPHVFTVRTPEPARTALAMESEAHEPAVEDALGPVPLVPEPELPMPTASRTAPEPETAPPAKPATGSELDRQALIAMARRAAEKVAREAPPAPRASNGRSLPRSGLLLAVGVAVFLIAGFWLVAGPNLRGLVQSFSVGAMRASNASAMTSAPAHAALSVEKQQGSLSDPAGADGVVERAITGDGGEEAEPVPARAAPASASTADLLATVARGQDLPAAVAPNKPEGPIQSGPVEMPPAMVGPLSLRHAAAQGDPRSQFEVAARFAEGKGVPQDFAQAATWYQRAAAQGFATAQYRLGTLYERGLGVAADPARARVWYGRAAEQGNLRAMHNLAVLSVGRPGLKPDYPSAVQWFTEAAERGLADSQYNLGILYESGLGVPTSNHDAYKWYALAARSGDKDATRRRDAIRAKLDAASVRAADALVIQWRAKAVEPAVNDGRVAGQAWQPVRQ